jgi:hypothetical protein
LSASKSGLTWLSLAMNSTLKNVSEHQLLA